MKRFFIADTVPAWCAVVVVTPLIDYSKMTEHVNFLYDIAKKSQKSGRIHVSLAPAVVGAVQ